MFRVNTKHRQWQSWFAEVEYLEDMDPGENSYVGSSKSSLIEFMDFKTQLSASSSQPITSGIDTSSKSTPTSPMDATPSKRRFSLSQPCTSKGESCSPVDISSMKRRLSCSPSLQGTSEFDAWRKLGKRHNEFCRCFLFCLPEHGAKIPVFTGGVDKLIEGYQDRGYGFPACDVYDGSPQKTTIPLQQTTEQFYAFLTTLYPCLKGSNISLYKMNKQKVLIPTNVTVPRHIRYLKYKGILVVIPEACHGEGRIVANAPEYMVGSTTDGDDSLDQSSGDSGPPMECPMTNSVPSCSQVKIERHDASSDNRASSHNVHQNIAKLETIYENARIIQSKFTCTKTLVLCEGALLQDVLKAYASDADLMIYNLEVHIQVVTGNLRRIPCKTLFCLFWSQVFEKYFRGDLEKVPITCPELVRDKMAEILGKILVHGLALCSYWPSQFSIATVASMVRISCSNILLLKSFQQFLSPSEWQMVQQGLVEVQQGNEQFTSETQLKLTAVLSTCGCREVPSPKELQQSLIDIARSVLCFQPFWTVMTMGHGVLAYGTDLFENCSETTLTHFYESLVPSGVNLCNLITYQMSTDEVCSILEMSAKDFLEKFILRANNGKVISLLKFWCGSDCLCGVSLTVSFHASSLGHLAPTADRHSNNLSISRNYMSEEGFSAAMDKALKAFHLGKST